jgi:hypothetical protein
MHSFDQKRPAPIISHRLADSGQALGQRRFTHKRAGPAVIKEFVSRHHAVTMLDEVDEHLKYLGLNGNYCTRTMQLVALLIEDTITKVIDHCDCLTTGTASTSVLLPSQGAAGGHATGG